MFVGAFYEIGPGARTHIWITSPWVTQRAVNLLLRDVLPKVADGLEVRIVHRVKELGDLEITDLEALKALEDSGCSACVSVSASAGTATRLMSLTICASGVEQ